MRNKYNSYDIKRQLCIRYGNKLITKYNSGNSNTNVAQGPFRNDGDEPEPSEPALR